MDTLQTGNISMNDADTYVDLYDRVYWFEDRLTCAVGLLRAVRTAMCLSEDGMDEYIDALIGLERYFELVLESFEPVRLGAYSLARPAAE